MLHELKIWPEYFLPVAHDLKRAELRVMDRPHEVGDELVLREWNPESETYTGRECHRIITHIHMADNDKGLLSIRRFEGARSKRIQK